jgi:hypothetical protein
MEKKLRQEMWSGFFKRVATNGLTEKVTTEHRPRRDKGESCAHLGKSSPGSRNWKGPEAGGPGLFTKQ